MGDFGRAITRMFTPSKSDGGAPIVQPTPAAPTRTDAADAAKKNILSRKRSKTILTSGLGDTTEATTRSILLGSGNEGKETLGG